MCYYSEQYFDAVDAEIDDFVIHLDKKVNNRYSIGLT